MSLYNTFFNKFLNTARATVYTWGLLKLGRSYTHKAVSVVLRVKAQQPTADASVYYQGTSTAWFTGPPSIS